MDDFVALRRLSGTDYHSQIKLLEYFDRFLVESRFNGPSITRSMIDQYLQSMSHLRPRVQYNRFCVVSQLCRYIARTDSSCHVPEPIRWPSKTYCPYIFSQSEISELLSAASALPPSDSLRPHTYHALFALLYSTGIRIGEAFRLKLKDCLFDEKLLYIAEGKFRKTRWLPLHPSISTVLETYVDRRTKIGPKSPESPLFINRLGLGLRHCVVYQTFRQLLMQCGISHHKNGGPRIHDLRHTFAINRLLSWYQDGQDVNARLPALATYMGHVDVCFTHVYLKPTAALLDQVNTRFHSHYLQNVKPEGERP